MNQQTFAQSGGKQTPSAHQSKSNLSEIRSDLIVLPHLISQETTLELADLFVDGQIRLFAIIESK